MLGNVAVQCWTNSVTEASVTVHHLLFLGDFRRAHPPLLPLRSLPLITRGILSITQWERSSFWQENGEDWLGNKSCHKQRFLLREFGPDHLYEQSVYVDWKATSCLNKPSDWQKLKCLSYFLTLVIKVPSLEESHSPSSSSWFIPTFPAKSSFTFSQKQSRLLTSVFIAYLHP